MATLAIALATSACSRVRCDRNEDCVDGALCNPTTNRCEYTPTPHCGDGIPQTGEVCDDGNTSSGDGCRADCQSDEECGNGIVDPDEGEICDDGNTDAGDGCSPTCQLEYCGNGVTDPGEACDDGNSTSADGCRADCQSDETCGNGLVDPASNEQCDDGNFRSHDGCSSGCTVEHPTWVLVSVAGPLPPARNRFGAAYDSLNDRIIIYGGSWFGPGYLADTWELARTNPTWTETTPAGSPPMRAMFSASYDTMAERTIAFGGDDNSGGVAWTLADTWEYDAGTGAWTQLSPINSPPGRAMHVTAFDAMRGAVVLFGGTDASFNLLNDTWELLAGPPKSWNQRTSATAPAPRVRHCMSYDVARDRTLLFGGTDSNYLGDTWEWDAAGSTWQQLAPTSEPPPRASASMAFDASRQRAVMFGGEDSSGTLGDTWEFDGQTATWSETTPESSPPPHQDHVLVYDSARERIVLIGLATAGTFSDVWEYYLASGWPDETCADGEDNDFDALVDCADPDCEGRPCGPGQTCASGVCQP